MMTRKQMMSLITIATAAAIISPAVIWIIGALNALSTLSN